MRVYLDLAVLLNFFVDWMLLQGTNQLTGFPADWKRSAAAAGLGGLYSGACLLPDFRFLANLLWRIVSLTAMAVAAFGWNRGTLKRGCVFLLLAMAMGGVAVSLNRSNFPALFLAAGGIWLLCRGVCNCGAAREYVPVELNYGGTCLTLTALRDTGNTLRDPVSGERVLVLSPEAAQQLTGLRREQLALPLETLSRRPLPGLRLIPYRAVGQTGFLLGLRIDDAKIGSRRGSAIVALAPEDFGRGQAYQALTGGMV